MNQVHFGFIGWCQEGTSDKIWGWLTTGAPLARREGEYDISLRDFGRDCYIFWGRRRGAMSFKKTKIDGAIRKLQESKVDSGYDRINIKQLTSMVPDFQERLEKRLLFKILMDQ